MLCVIYIQTVLLSMPGLETEPSPAVVFSDLEVTDNPGYEPADTAPLEWSRSMTDNSIPYYVTVSEREGLTHTSWLHPHLAQLLDSFPDLDEHIRYSAYRTAFKLRSLQTLTRLSRLQLQSFYQSLAQHNLLRGSAPFFLSPLELEALLATAFTKSSFSGLEGSRSQLIASSTELTLNFLLSCYDPGRVGAVSLSSVKSAVTMLSVAPLADKYKYLHQLTTESPGLPLDKDGFTQLLSDLLRLTVFLDESLAFGEKAVPACFHSLLQTLGKQDSTRFRLSLDEFTQWALMEPQSLVWIPTLHRVAAIERTKHSVKCGLCRAYPIQGFNFRCQKCANLNICQSCFFSQRTSGMHKVTHPIREYALPSTSKEDLKDLLRVLRNKLSLSHYRRSKSKQSYLPHQRHLELELSPSTQERGSQAVHDKIKLLAAELRKVEQSVPWTDGSAPAHKEWEENNKLRARLDALEDKNRQLQAQLDTSVPLADSVVRESLLSGREVSRDIAYQHGRMSRSLQQERMEVRVDVLETHNRSLEEQLFSLRRELVVGDRGDPPSPSAEGTKSSDRERKISEEERLFALVSRILADPIPSKQRRLNPAVSQAVCSLGDSLSSLVLELQLHSSSSNTS